MPPKIAPAAISKVIPPSMGTHGGGKHNGEPPPGGGGGAEKEKFESVNENMSISINLMFILIIISNITL